MHLYIIYVFRCLVIIIHQRDANLMTPQTTDMGKMVQKASIKIFLKNELWVRQEVDLHGHGITWILICIKMYQKSRFYLKLSSNNYSWLQFRIVISWFETLGYLHKCHGYYKYIHKQWIARFCANLSHGFSIH